MFTIRINPKKNTIEFLISNDIIASYNRYARCHTEDWNMEVGEEIPICEECHRPIDTPSQYLYGPLHIVVAAVAGPVMLTAFPVNNLIYIRTRRLASVIPSMIRIAPPPRTI
uniref:Uncharacterized protein n=1 Tax=Trichogramma kaykai TaxID=54128 RepID=A0ABD2W9D9_9HYME